MATCRHCEKKDRQIAQQSALIEKHEHELDLAKARIAKLEQVLLDSCDYAEVCKHFPAGELLGEARHN